MSTPTVSGDVDWGDNQDQEPDFDNARLVYRDTRAWVEMANFLSELINANGDDPFIGRNRCEQG